MSSSPSETPYRLQLGSHRGGRGTAAAARGTSRGTKNQKKQPEETTARPPQTDNSLSSSSIIDDFHPLHFKDKLNRQASQLSSSAGPGFEFTGPSVDEDGISVSSFGSIGWYMTKSARQRLRNNKLLSEDDKKIVQYLAMRKFHIPGNSYWQDYFYWYVKNKTTKPYETCVVFQLTHKTNLLGSPTTIPSCAFGLRIRVIL